MNLNNGINNIILCMVPETDNVHMNLNNGINNIMLFMVPETDNPHLHEL